jgi:hypothetical protein
MTYVETQKRVAKKATQHQQPEPLSYTVTVSPEAVAAIHKVYEWFGTSVFANEELWQILVYAMHSPETDINTTARDRGEWLESYRIITNMIDELEPTHTQLLKMQKQQSVPQD